MPPARRKVSKRSVIEFEEVAKLMGKPAATFMGRLARYATAEKLEIYLVGGPVRDLLLGRQFNDLDFVLVGDAIDLALDLYETYGGWLKAHDRFLTAKWVVDARSANGFLSDGQEFTLHIDFASARSEGYPEPAALPRVRRGSIKLDMRRRDFSINALALQITPFWAAWKVLDLYGGEKDLDERRIRALHRHSFRDDPTRIFRACRFATRLDFEIERNTLHWIRNSLPYVAKLSGARLRAEIRHILNEERPGETLLHLQELGVLTQIHPDFKLSAQLPDLIERVKTRIPPWTDYPHRAPALRLCMLFAEVDGVTALSIARRLDYDRRMTDWLAGACNILGNRQQLADPSRAPSTLAPLLEDLAEVSVHAGWLMLHDDPAARATLEAWMLRWRKIRPGTDGNDLLALGLPPGPIFRQTLDQLRDAWLDGEVQSSVDERNLLDRLLAEANGRLR